MFSSGAGARPAGGAVSRVFGGAWAAVATRRAGAVLATALLAWPGAGAVAASQASITQSPPAKVNAWGRPAARYELEQARGGDRGPVRFRVLDEGGAGGAHLVFPGQFERGRLYRASLKIRARQPVSVDVMLRRDGHPYDPFAIKTVSVGGDWQQVDIEGRVLASAASLRVAPRRTGIDVWVDEVGITTGDGPDFSPRNSAAIPRQFFGMHLIRLGSHTQWPPFAPGIVRLSDTATTWKDLQPSPGWNFSSNGFRRLDFYLDFVRKRSRDTELLYVLGQTPAWASSEPERKSAYGPGHSAPPRDLELWRDYVRTMARRYAGRIRYWELWNEPDSSLFYAGPMETMVEMARIAREELKAADPDNLLISPGLTTSQGMAWLHRFLSLGGGRHVDAIGFHWYFGERPESIAAFIDNVQTLLRQHGQEGKPLWNTEGGLNLPRPEAGRPPLNVAQQRGLTLRAMLTMWSRGVDAFCYYFWEGRFEGERMVAADYRTPTPAGLAYQQGAQWLLGARMTAGERDADGRHVFTFERDGRSFRLAWSTDGPASLDIPDEWRARRIARLDGSADDIGSAKRVELSAEPVLIE
ncbi:MAG TPA: glycosyl hydrolase [Burkholderiaceae bacterium]|nr:glycosyl hydrolase [Burkholderiaceae bacterium]